ncbi:MAG: hypothetical protein LAO31_19185 [Acidobacteriia bacterium]|nr:hypothetical protein [Terriglobia bacterium]
MIAGALSLWPGVVAANQVPVRFGEGSVHGFLEVRSTEGVLIASGDLLQVTRGPEVESRMVFHFKDGSLFDETVVFTQQRVFTMRRYRLVERGSSFSEDTEISLQRASGKYRVKTKRHKDGREEIHEGTLDLPADVYNGMVLTVAKNLPKQGAETVHIVAFTPAPRIIPLDLSPAGEQKVWVGGFPRSTARYVFKPRLGIWLRLMAKISGRMPPDSNVWIVTDGVPGFVRFEGSLVAAGPVWRIDLASPRWPG